VAATASDSSQQKKAAGEHVQEEPQGDDNCELPERKQLVSYNRKLAAAARRVRALVEPLPEHLRPDVVAEWAELLDDLDGKSDRADSLEIREGRGGPLAEPGDPDAAAYAEGAALPNPGAKLAGPTFEEWLAAA
jgi:hypothetical protein